MNVRFTSIRKFWPQNKKGNIYLWYGAKRERCLSDVLDSSNEVLKDRFESINEFESANNDCIKLYHLHIQRISAILNKIHEIDEPVLFWKTALGYWLHRHICITYDKFTYLDDLGSKVIDDIVLLNPKCYHTPENHYDYLDCFCTDYGVQQLVSMYYNLFYRKELPSLDLAVNYNYVKKDINIKSDVINTFKKTFLRLFYKIRKSKTLLMGLGYSKSIYSKLMIKSRGRVSLGFVPSVIEKRIDKNSVLREQFVNREFSSNYEKYLFYTIKDCIPKIFIEYFKDYYNTYKKELNTLNCKFVVSEYWITDNKLSIFCAIARSKGIKLISQEHSFGTPLIKYSSLWRDLEGADMYLTSGWECESNNRIIKGGVTNYKIREYKYISIKKRILIVGQTWYPYIMEFSTNPFNLRLVKRLKFIQDILDRLPETICKDIVFRQRSHNSMLDIPNILELRTRNIKIDSGDFTSSIHNAKIILLDHISAPLAEVLLIGVPFILFIADPNIINDNYYLLFKNLEKENIVHFTPQSVTQHLEKVSNNIEIWWKSEKVQLYVKMLSDSYLADSSETIDFLTSL